MIRIQQILLDSAVGVLSSIMESKINEISAIKASKDDEIHKTNPSIWAIKELSIGKLTTQIRSLKKSCRLLTYYRNTLGETK